VGVVNTAFCGKFAIPARFVERADSLSNQAQSSMSYNELIPYGDNAANLFSAIADLPWAIWLDSGGRDRFDILVADPVCTIVTRGETSEITSATSVYTSTLDPLDILRNEISKRERVNSIPPFSGGAVGYWSYDLSRRWIDFAEGSAPALPEMMVGIYDWAIVLDHQTQTARLVAENYTPQTAIKLIEIVKRLKNISQTVRADFQVRGKVRSNFTQQQYGKAFEKIQKYLMAGDCYQVNLAQTFSAQARGDALQAYLKLRELSPAPYSAFMNLPEVKVLSVSPEKFLQLSDGKVETKPIKGTRQRGVTAESDAQLKQELQNTEKDRAENLMIVDLLRNDLSKSCQRGSVIVEKMFKIESYANVHHLVSTISGKLKETEDACSLLRSCFPGGSITGAPKKRAMQIIEQLEGRSRDIYCGSIGYIGWDGKMNSNIAIRTLIYTQGEIKFSVGGGIVSDSKMEAEYQETLDKASGMLRMLHYFGGES
jgi:para-aminobenzoate synthetase component 1